MKPNLFADFVKGNDFGKYPAIIREGIALHRRIDTYIDNHPSVIELLNLLYSDLPKVSGIAVDLFFDHLLAKNWSMYNKFPLEIFVDDFFKYSDENNVYYSRTFEQVLDLIQKDNWITNYQYIEGLNFACTGLSNRISFENELKNGVSVFLKFEEIITQTFSTFIDDAIKEFKIDKFIL
jgi:acyl carrier protein phosphodiesterase